MGQGAAVGRGDDRRKARLLRPLPPHRGFDGQGDLDLGLAWLDGGKDLAEHLFVQLDGSADAVDFRLVLDQPHLLDQPLEGGSGNADLCQGLGQHRRGRVQHIVALEGQLPDTQILQQAGQEQQQAAGVEQDGRPRHILLGLDPVAEIGQQKDPPSGRDEQDARGLADPMITPGIAAQVAPVLRLGDEQGVHLLAAEDSLQFLDPS